MKKLFFILLSLNYLASSAGATVQLHYCMDKLVGTGMHDTESDKCGKCGMEKQEGCCKDESKQIKIADDQKPVSKFFLNIVDAEDVLQGYSSRNETLYISNGSYFHPQINGPPNSGIELYKYLCVFRI